MSPKNSSIKSYINPIESLKGIGKTTSSVAKTEMSESMKTFWEQLLGTTEYKRKSSKEGTLTEGHEVVLSQKLNEQKQSFERIKPAYDYVGEILRSGEHAQQKQNKELEQQVQKILQELQRLAQASIVLEKEVIAAKGNAIVKVGKYHVNFFEWLLIEIQQARMQVEDAGAWLATMSGKKKKKDYWSKVDNHGTKFMLSGERSVSTQTA